VVTGSPRNDSAAVRGLRGVTTRPPVLMTLYAALLLICCGVIVVGGTLSVSLGDALFWISLTAAANVVRLSTLPEVDIGTTLGSIVTVAAALLFPPEAVVVFTLIGALNEREIRGEATLVMAVFNRAMAALSGAAASWAALLVYAAAGGRTWQVVPATMVAYVAYDLANTGLLAVMLVVRRARTWGEALAEAANPFPRFAVNAGVSAMLSLLVVLLVRDVGRWAVVLIAIPLWLSYSAQRSARQAQDRAEELADRVRELEVLNQLSGALLSVRTVPQIPGIVSSALEQALATPTVVVDLDGAGGVTVSHARVSTTEPVGDRVSIAGAEPAAIVVPGGVDERATAVVEASAALVGLTLTRLQLESELAETERARTALTGRILEEATHERSRIALAVHDDVLPLFAAAQMKIDTLDTVLERDPSRAGELADGAMRAVTDGIAQLRDTLEALRRNTLVPGTLRPGVTMLLADMQSRTGVRTTLDASDPLPALPFAVELLAFETIRGSLANVERHAHAAALLVELQVTDGRLVVLMRDDGRGFDPTTVGQRRHGLALMRQRAELARGRLEVSSTVGAGTTVRLEVPTW
jgi:signal transduction histidine kinase